MSLDVEDWVRRWSLGIAPTGADRLAGIYTPDGERWDVSIDQHSKARPSSPRSCPWTRFRTPCGPSGR